MASSTVAILDVCRIATASDTPEFSMPITFFDAMWIPLSAVEILFFYQPADPTPSHFNSIIVPRLEHSLSLTLTDFSPLAGRLKWPPDEPTPVLVYKPNDSVSVTIAESMNPDSFVHLVGNKPYNANESRLYVPKLQATDTEAAVISFQVTLFTNRGVAIGVSFHHTVLDGKSISIFLKAWAHMNKQLSANSVVQLLPPDLTPFLDRSAVQDPDGLCMKILDHRDKFMPSASRRSLKLLLTSHPDPTLVRATFEISPDDARKLRELALSKLETSDSNTQRLSSFVLAYSYTLVCLVKATKLEKGLKKPVCGILVESRRHLNPPLPDNYLGNCITACSADVGEEVIRKDDGFVGAAKIISECIQGVRNKSVYQVFNDNLFNSGPLVRGEFLIGMAGSPRLELYQIDFGWERPVKMVYTSVNDSGSISFAESGDGSGGLEIGVVMTKEEMEVFDSLFVGGLKHMSA